ncbi:magnesium dechelatase [Marchantia polymorpha subsp. ruderalis]|uniref:Staygreen protein domain-containing protein n=2 Tax=Marchantia polymorpha TaxID=3197 RepID=A0A176WRX8_MARPO|nr:hypothetical protein AXG93_3546s1190 [Marchantia polymorpha subsp. ruderalis]PTQ49981.1 hypothetical protein MARPO_0001s0049 [Marchantia polymorpha]BBM98905.1 hypothetical protein Mp_1g17090 [Marchantia polymorpha subsp. ruderalis]|eukprot:PTQ49981.1 hypothetical protein MARPO_0001s0049 [Marchantia polymorpha]
MAAAACACITAGLATSLSPANSKEKWDSLQAICSVSPAARRSTTPLPRAQNASVSRSSGENYSSFWGKESCGTLLGRNQAQQSLAACSFRSVPLVESRLFGPAIFEASKLRVLFLGKEDDKGHLQQPRIYTLTHSDVTAKITLAVAQEINKAQLMGWYSQLQRDEVLAEWRRTKGEMTLHVHCHISGGNWLHDIIAKLRFYIFRKELPVVLEAFMHGDRDLFSKHPELQSAPVWVYFHSNMEEYNRMEFWGPLSEATKGASELQKEAIHQALDEIVKNEKKQQFPKPTCSVQCECCSRHAAVIPIPESFRMHARSHEHRERGVPQ